MCMNMDSNEICKQIKNVMNDEQEIQSKMK